MFIAEAAISLVLASSPARRNAGIHNVKLDSRVCGLIWRGDASVEAQVHTADSIEIALAKDLSTVSDVAHVVLERVEGSLLVWIIARDPDASARWQIYQKEMDIIEGFPDIEFDFNLIASQGRELQQLMSAGGVVYSHTGE